MITATETEKKHLDELHTVISHAMEKLHVKKETELKSYLPWGNGHIHHISLLRLKKENPHQLLKMIKEHILNKEHPTKLSPKPRQLRSPKVQLGRKGPVTLSQASLQKVIEALKKSGNEDLVQEIDPYQSLSKVRKMLLEQIKKDKPNVSLLNTYLRLIEKHEAS